MDAWNTYRYNLVAALYWLSVQIYGYMEYLQVWYGASVVLTQCPGLWIHGILTGISWCQHCIDSVYRSMDTWNTYRYYLVPTLYWLSVQIYGYLEYLQVYSGASVVLTQCTDLWIHGILTGIIWCQHCIDSVYRSMDTWNTYRFNLVPALYWVSVQVYGYMEYLQV